MISGGCFCGAIRFQCQEPPVAARACWCRDCQYLSSGNASINATFRIDSFTRSGDVADYVSVSDGGTVMRRSFCPKCGTPLFSQSEKRPDLIVVRGGSLDDPAIAAPQMFIWRGSAPDWVVIDPAMPCCEAQPPALP